MYLSGDAGICSVESVAECDFIRSLSLHGANFSLLTLDIFFFS